MGPLLWSFTILLAILLALLLFWKLWFCRKPKRQVPKRSGAIISPADGTVAVVQRFSTMSVKAEKWNKGSVEFLARDVAEKGWFVLIVMTPLNVHYQRAPVSGTVLFTHHEPGKFLNAVKGAERLLTLENERNEILLKGKHGKVKVVQIAGYLARRISCSVSENEKVEKGEPIGFINIGSQVALLFDEGVKMKVRPGMKVIDGETIIGEYQ